MQQPLVDAKTSRQLQELLQQTDDAARRFLGFPAALDFDYQELAPILQRFLNNVGDPAEMRWFGMTSKEMEREVLAFFAELFRAPKDN